jgi:hypothetical protein
MVVFAQDDIHIKDYVRKNDIGIKIIDKKKLKKDIADLELEKTDKKALWKRLKQEEKPIRKEIKAFNKEVYERRRTEEYAIRSGLQSATKAIDSVDVNPEEKLHAKKIDKVFDEKVIEEPDTIPVENTKMFSGFIPERRFDYPWIKKVKNNCRWKIAKIDYVEQDTLYFSETSTIYFNKKDKNEPKGSIDMTLWIEDKMLFLETHYKFDQLTDIPILKSKKTDKIIILGKKKQSIELPFYGIRQTATVNFDHSKQNIKIRYQIPEELIDLLKEHKWKRLEAFIGGTKFTFPLSKNFTGKAQDSSIHNNFQPYFDCLSND